MNAEILHVTPTTAHRVLLQKILKHEHEECMCGMRGIYGRKRCIFSLFYGKEKVKHLSF
jgi:hypothetical protein